MTWTVTRQGQWPTGDNVVEVSEGGIDYCNPDALVEMYKGSGEFQEYSDPREAAEVAIRICKEWREREKQKPDVNTKGKNLHRPTVGAGATGGMTFSFDPCTFKQLRQWAKETWDKLEKCDVCGDPMPDKRHRWRANDWSGIEFCSEYCAEKEIEYQAIMEQEQLEEEEAPVKESMKQKEGSKAK